MKTMLPILVFLALSGCSSGSPTEPPPPEESLGEVIDYSAIAGTWSGWDNNGDFTLAVEVEAEARMGESVGEFTVLQANSTPFCEHQLRAASASPPTYLFDGSVGTCSPTTLTFVHDPDEDRIALSTSNLQSGFLVRGDDPGPPPQ